MQNRPLHDILSRPAPAALAGLMAEWYGVHLDAARLAPEGPHALRLIHRLRNAEPGLFAHNHVVLPVREHGDRTVFYVENQGVAVWGVEDLDADDPPVWVREDRADAEWHQDAPSVAVFAVQMAVFESVLGAPHGAAAAWLTVDEAERVLASVPRLALPPWHWPTHPLWFHAGERVLAHTCPNGDDRISLFIGARDAADIRFVEPFLSDAWEHYSG